MHELDQSIITYEKKQKIEQLFDETTEEIISLQADASELKEEAFEKEVQVLREALPVEIARIVEAGLQENEEEGLLEKIDQKEQALTNDSNVTEDIKHKHFYLKIRI